MTQQLGEAPAPWGAPEVRADREQQPHFVPGRPRLGGLAEPVRFSDSEAAVIEALADTMIPPGRGFPAPSEVGIVDFFGRYTAPVGQRATLYPFVEEESLKADLARLGDGFVAADVDGRTEEVARLESDEEELFGKLRALVYYGYYSATEVTLAIQREIPAGRDYHGPPLPYGYLHCIEDWDDELLATAGQGAGYVATEDVVPVDLSKLSWLQQEEGKA